MFNDHDTYFSKVFSKKKIRFAVMPAIIIICLGFSFTLIYNPEYGATIVISTFVLVLLYLIRLAFSHEPFYRARIFVFLILGSTGMITAFAQGMQSSVLENFVEFNTTKNIFGINLSPAFVNSFETIGVIVFGIILTRIILRKRELGQTVLPTTNVIRGLLFYVVAFLIIPIGICLSDNNGVGSLAFPIIMLLIVGGGEVHINATNYALVGNLIEPKYQGLFTGYFFVSIAVGIIASGFMANYTIGNSLHAKDITATGTNHLYLNLFVGLSCLAAIIAIILLSIKKYLNKVFSTTL